MLQTLLALVVIFFFLARLGWQFYHNQIPKNQFIFWLAFWFISGLLVVYIRNLDALAARLGFSSSGIEILLYIAIVVIFYFIFRIRLKLERIERDLTTLTRSLALGTKSNPSLHDSKRPDN